MQNAKDIQRYSATPGEAELLLSPNMEFVVTKPLFMENGYRCIEMQQIPDETLWS